MTRERRGRHVGCAQPHSYSGVAEGGTGRTRGAESSPSSSPCPSSSLSPRVPPLVIPAWLLLCLPLPTSSLASAVVDGDRVPMWHGRLFVEGGRRWRCQSGAVFGLVVIGFGDSTGFRMSKVVVLQFSTAFRVSKVVGVRIWGGLGCLSFVLGF